MLLQEFLVVEARVKNPWTPPAFGGYLLSSPALEAIKEETKDASKAGHWILSPSRFSDTYRQVQLCPHPPVPVCSTFVREHTLGD